MASNPASLLPNGEQQFCDANGAPYAAGKVYFYIPNTSTLKNTWQDPQQNVANTNPVTLDAAGRAIIYGSGQYRQVLQDSAGNTIWDQLTSSNLEGAGIFWGGTATGGGNTYNITVDSSAAAYYAGMQIAFISDYSNTAAAQVNVTNANSVVLGAVNLYKQTSSGPAACSGGEVPLNNIIQAEYDGTQFQIINSVGYAEPAGVIKIYGGTVAPAGYLLCYGQAISRTTYAALFAAIGTNFGVGDGASTFNLPDLRGTIPVGKDDMGGTAANRITNAACGITGTTIGAQGGSQLLAQHNHTATSSVTDPGHQHSVQPVAGIGGGPHISASTGGADASGLTGVGTTGISVSTTVANAGSGASANVQPSLIVTYIIKT